MADNGSADDVSFSSMLLQSHHNRSQSAGFQTYFYRIFFFSDALGTCTWRNQRSLKASVSSTICLRSESDMSCTVEGYLGRFDWVQQVNSLARPIIYTTTVMDKSLGTLCISGAFSNSHRSNPSPHPTINAGRVYPEFFFLVSTLCRVGGGQTAKKF